MTLKGIIKIFATPSASGRVKVGFSLSMSDKAAEVYTDIVTRELTRVNDEQAREFMTTLGQAFAENPKTMQGAEYQPRHALCKVPSVGAGV